MTIQNETVKRNANGTFAPHPCNADNSYRKLCDNLCCVRWVKSICMISKGNHNNLGHRYGAAKTETYGKEYT